MPDDGLIAGRNT